LILVTLLIPNSISAIALDSQLDFGNAPDSGLNFSNRQDQELDFGDSQ
jgi:hypothetical protein